MDTRVRRSKQKITESFIKLRIKKPLERITVAELCRNAEINKSTFYAHYHDIYDLSDQVEASVIGEIVSSLTHPGDIVENPTLFTKELLKAFADRRERINILFSGTRSVLLPQKIERALKDLVYTIHPNYRNKPEFNIMLCYKIYGGYYAFVENSKYGAEYVSSVIADLSEK